MMTHQDHRQPGQPGAPGLMDLDYAAVEARVLSHYATQHPYIQAWCIVTQRPDVVDLLAKADTDKAPADAVFFHHGDNRWWVLHEVVDHHLRDLIRITADKLFTQLDI